MGIETRSPIGNLSLRALKILSGSMKITTEDTESTEGVNITQSLNLK